MLAPTLVSQSEDPERLQAAWTFLKYITSETGVAAVAVFVWRKETGVRSFTQITDLHFAPGDKSLFGTSPKQRLADGVSSWSAGGEGERYVPRDI